MGDIDAAINLVDRVNNGTPIGEIIKELRQKEAKEDPKSEHKEVPGSEENNDADQETGPIDV